MSSYRFGGRSWGKSNSSPGQRKYRRNIFRRLRDLGYTTEGELRPFLPAIRRAVWDRIPFQYPTSLTQMHRQAMGEAKAKKKQAKVAAAQEKLRQERFLRTTTDFRWGHYSWF